MDTLTLYLLEPPREPPQEPPPDKRMPREQATLALHFGRQGIGFEEAAESMPSDSLFAALTSLAALTEGLPPDTDRAPAFTQAFVDAAPPLTHSSVFPRIGALPLLPRPALMLPKMDEEQRRKIGKGFKKLRYLSPALFAAVCAGRPFAGEPLIMQSGKIWIAPEEAIHLPKEWQRNGECDDLWRRRLSGLPVWAISQIPRVTVDRVSGASNYYEVGQVFFAPRCGLYLLARHHDARARATFELLLTLLGESGLGGRRSSGLGAFRWRDGGELNFDFGRPVGRRIVLLSRYLPRQEELPALRSERSSYQLVSVGGWLASPGRASQRRQRITMVAEGAVLDTGAAPVRGELVDVRPDYRKSSRPHPLYGQGNGTTHPVYRSGLALAVPIPDEEAQ